MAAAATTIAKQLPNMRRFQPVRVVSYSNCSIAQSNYQITRLLNYQIPPMLRADLCHLVRMRWLRLSLLFVGALGSGACFQMTTVLKVNADGSGTIDHRMLYSASAIAQLRQFAALGGRGQNPDPLSEQQARDMTASIGPGVTYVVSAPITTPDGQGREATFAFTDVSQLRISTQPATPAGVKIRAQGFSTEAETVTFSMTHEASGNAVLHIHVPEPNFLDALGSPAAAGQIGMIKTTLSGARVLLVAEPAGTVVRTSSPYAEGRRVTLLEVDLDAVLRDETLLPRLQAATTQDEAKLILTGASGLKINLDRDITIEFRPGK